MQVDELLQTLADRQIRLGLNGQSLEVTGQVAALTPELRDVLRQHKPELLERLRTFERSRNTLAPDQMLPVRPVCLPLSYAQEPLWFLHCLQPSSSAYTVPALLLIEGDLDVNRLRLALQQLLQRHEILRTHYPMSHGETRQSIVAMAELQLETVHLAQPLVDGELPAPLLQRLVRPFDLAEDLPLRCCLFSHASRHLLLLTMHHIASDGRSVDVLLQEAAALYNGARIDSLPAALQYADYALSQRERLSSGVMDTALRFWTQYLEGAPPLLSLFQCPLPAPAVGHNALQLPFTLSAECSRSVEALARQHGTSVFVVLLAASFVFLHKLSGDCDLVMGTPVSNRASAAMQSAVGLYVNTVPLRAVIDVQHSFADLLGELAGQIPLALAHHDYPFDKLVQALRPERSSLHNPLFQALFVYLEQDTAPLVLHGLQTQRLDLPPQQPKFDLVLNLRRGADGFSGLFECTGRHFSPAMADALPLQLAAVLEQLLAQAGAPLWTCQLNAACARQPLPQPVLASEIELEAIWAARCGAGLALPPRPPAAAGVYTLLLDAMLLPQPDGVWGELYLSGPGVGGFDIDAAAARLLQERCKVTEKIALWPAALRARRVDGRLQLQAPAVTTPVAVAAVTDILEQALALIWTEILGRPVHSRHDNFFHLGGHSLLAVRLSNEICLAFGDGLSVQHVFEHPTVAAMAVQVRALGCDNARLELIAETLLEVYALSGEELDSALSGAVA